MPSAPHSPPSNAPLQALSSTSAARLPLTSVTGLMLVLAGWLWWIYHTAVQDYTTGGAAFSRRLHLAWQWPILLAVCTWFAVFTLARYLHRPNASAGIPTADPAHNPHPRGHIYIAIILSSSLLALGWTFMGYCACRHAAGVTDPGFFEPHPLGAFIYPARFVAVPALLGGLFLPMLAAPRRRFHRGLFFSLVAAWVLLTLWSGVDAFLEMLFTWSVAWVQLLIFAIQTLILVDAHPEFNDPSDLLHPSTPSPLADTTEDTVADTHPGDWDQGNHARHSPPK